MIFPRFFWPLAVAIVPLSLIGCGGSASRSNSTPSPTGAPVGNPTASPRPTATTKPTAQPVALRLACIGDSITAGIGTSDPATKSFPSQLSQALGSGYQVRNFGVPGATVSTRGLSYRAQGSYQLALNFKPDILIIALGTNDTLLFNDRTEKSADFRRDYESLVGAFKKANPAIQISCCLPTPAYASLGNKNAILQSTVNPLVREIAKNEGAKVFDLYTPLQNHPEFFPDTLHPNDDGAKAMASEIFRNLTEKPLQ